MDNDFVKRVKVKGYSRVTPNGRVYTVSPHYRVIRKLRSQEKVNIPRPKLI